MTLYKSQFHNNKKSHRGREIELRYFDIDTPLCKTRNYVCDMEWNANWLKKGFFLIHAKIFDFFKTK